MSRMLAKGAWADPEINRHCYANTDRLALQAAWPERCLQRVANGLGVKSGMKAPHNAH